MPDGVIALRMVKEILDRNYEKHKRLDTPYNPLTGEGCVGNRVRLEVEDAPYFVDGVLTTKQSVFFLPESMQSEPIYQQLKEYCSIWKVFEEADMEYTPETVEMYWKLFCEERIKHDFEYFAFSHQVIEDGDLGQDIPFILKRGQRRALEVLEKMRLTNVPIRIIVLKARQMGISTLLQLYMFWIQSVHKTNWHSVIAAHVKDSSNTIRAMTDKVIENMPPIKGEKFKITPFKNTQNIKIIVNTGCRITIGSAESPESIRSQNPKMAHLSEVAFYPNTEKRTTSQLIGSIISPIKRVPLTMIAIESTANGVGDYFHGLWGQAKKGESAFEHIFLAWFYDDRYTQEINGTYNDEGGKIVEGTIEDFVNSLTDYEMNLFETEDECTLENLNWYRGKRGEMDTDELMLQEFPSNDIEAFQDSGMPAFRAAHVERLRGTCKPPYAVGELVADESPELFLMKRSAQLKGILENIRFIEDAEATKAAKTNDAKLKARKLRDKLHVWDFPDTSENVANRYLVVFDPQKGLSEKADWGVITVFDRYSMMWDGKPEVVAQWRGKVDKDVAIWIAAQIAKYYNNALLVVESNVYDGPKEDDAETIFDTLADYYDNLYSRTPADKIRDGAPIKYGFRMGKSTKPMIRTTFVAVLREQSYIERCNEALNEARTYERKQNGKFEAKDGHHDDIIDTRMIGLHVCFNEMDKPYVVENMNKTTRSRAKQGESSF